MNASINQQTMSPQHVIVSVLDRTGNYGEAK